jgi:hypothetical protein
MSRLTDDLRRVDIFNPHNFYGRHGAANDVCFITHSEGAWVVYHAAQVKAFGHYFGRALGPTGLRALAEAQAWASERSGVETWAKDPFGGYGPADYVASRLAGLAPALAALPPAPLPVFSWTGSTPEFGQARMLCAAKSKAAALRTADEASVSAAKLNESGGTADCELARAHPGEVFFCPLRTQEYGQTWRRLSTGEPVS